MEYSAYNQYINILSKDKFVLKLKDTNMLYLFGNKAIWKGKLTKKNQRGFSVDKMVFGRIKWHKMRCSNEVFKVT